MIIDFHTHAFPPAIAEKAINKLAKSANLTYYTDGTADGIRTAMKEAGVDLSVILPIATAPTQYETINRTAIELNEAFGGKELISFGSLHPDNDNYRQILSELVAHGIKGIKLHPVFQGVYFDDIRYKRIVDCASELGLITVIHAGFDIGFPGVDVVTPPHIRNLIDDVHPQKLVLAHMGGWYCWKEVEETLLDQDVYIDTSFSLMPGNVQKEGFSKDANPEDTPYPNPWLSNAQFCHMVRTLGANRVLFGTDTPWAKLGDVIDDVAASGLTEEELHLIFSQNAKALLRL